MHPLVMDMHFVKIRLTGESRSEFMELNCMCQFPPEQDSEHPHIHDFVFVNYPIADIWGNLSAGEKHKLS